MRGLPFYYGWAVLAASAVSELLVQGATSYSAGLFVLPIQAEFHVSRAAANTAVPILFVGIALLAPAVGRWLDRQSLRIVMPIGAVILSLSLLAISFTTSLWLIAAILAVPLAIAFMSVGPLNTSTLASRWFYRRRGLALGLAAVPTSGGGLLVVPLLVLLIQQHGWRGALRIEGLVMGAVIIALALLVVRDRPSDMGLADHPENLGRPSQTMPGRHGALASRTFLTSRDFWFPCLVLAVISGSCQAVVTTLPPYAVQLGLASRALPIMLFAAVAAVTKIAAGILSDRINTAALVKGAIFAMALSWLVFALLPSATGLFAGTVLAAAALGIAMPAAARIIASRFGSDHFAQIMGWGFAMTSVMALAASYFAGFMYDTYAGYQQAFLAFFAIVAAVSLMAIGLGRSPAAAMP